MRLLIGFIIMLSFPVLEVYIVLLAYHYIGWWIVLILAVSAVAGLMLIAEERLVFVARMVMTIQSGGSVFRSLFQSGRTVLAGALLIFPGLISDVLALLVLLLPSRWLVRNNRPVVDPGVIEGEFRRESSKKTLL